MRRGLTILLAAIVAGALVAVSLAPAADAKKGARGEAKKSKKRGKARKRRPAITLVSPMRVTVGETIVIRGRGFSRRWRSNTIVFRGDQGAVAFAKPRRARPRHLGVRVPASVERVLRTVESESGDRAVPTRVRLRVISSKRFGRVSRRRNSPVVVSARRQGELPPAPAACGPGDDWDGDLLPNALEASLKTDPCKPDTDGDGVEDGFEHHSARDLNPGATPAVSKRPFPNALDPSDANNDYDGDGLAASTEFRAWARPSAMPAPSGLLAYSQSPEAPAFGGPYGSVPTFGGHRLPLNYSDGNQQTVVVDAGHPEYRSYLDFDGNGRLSDDERDVDGDGLRNIDESHGGEADLALLMRIDHYSGLGEPCTKDEEGAYEYEPPLPRPMVEPDYLEWDSDGDGVWDGNDDQDSDGVSNVDEIKPPWRTCGDPPFGPLPVFGARDGSETAWDGGKMRRNPYNPCLPYNSDVCKLHEPR